ncbi:MAG: ATP-grasp domain-containing protein [Clostridia bacterium]|nr:ATP-grasp domain-containing protein [Clostridia bacterium]
MGAYTIVTDYLPIDLSPAKKLADAYWDVSTADLDTLERKIAEEKIDGVYTGVHEFNIQQMIKLCSRMNLPCYCTLDQWDMLEDKQLFKKKCREYGIPVTPEYAFNSINDAEIEYPVIVKPADGSGSRGFSICTCKDELLKGCEKAVKHSASGNVLIEKYMDYRFSVIINYTIIDGEFIYSGMSDKRSKKVFENGAPIMSFQMYKSLHEESYLETLNQKAIAMLRSLGLKNGVIWIEAFYNHHNDSFTFNELGYRFGGSLTYYPVEYYYGINQLELQIEYALNGRNRKIRQDVQEKKDHYCILPVHVRPGMIKAIQGLDLLSKKEYYLGMAPVHYEGETIEPWGSAQQVFAYIHFHIQSREEANAVQEDIMKTIRVIDQNGQDLLFNLFDETCI